MEPTKLANIKAAQADKDLTSIMHQEVLGHTDNVAQVVLSATSTLIKYLEGHTTKTEVVNQLESISTPDVKYVVEALQVLDDTLKTHENTDLSEVTDLMRQLVDEAKLIPKELPEEKEQQFVDYSSQLTGLKDAIEAVEKVVKAQKLIAEAPVVNVPETSVHVDAPNLEPLQSGFKDVVKAVKAIVIPEYKTDTEAVQKLLKESNKLLERILKKPIADGGGGGSSWPAVGTNALPAPLNLDLAGDLKTTLIDPLTNIGARIDTFGVLRTGQQKRLLGSTFGGATIDTTYVYTIAASAAGSVTAASGQATLATGTTANGVSTLTTKNKARYLSGRSNLFRGLFRLDPGTANNVREFGIFVDASNAFVFRLSGTTFSVVIKKAGTETVVSSGAFNGNGILTNQTYTLDTNYHSFEILYTTSSIRFMIDNVAVHRFVVTSSALTTSVVGQMYAGNANTASSTNNVAMDLLTWSVSQIGDSVNAPNFYNVSAAETRTLKTGGGTLQSILIGRSGGLGATMVVYDSTTATGSVLASFDIANSALVGNYPMGVEGVNFSNGLTYITNGTFSPGSVTFVWE